MESPLLGGESSRGIGRRDRFNRRSDAITYGSPYQKAAALVDLAEDGVGLPEEILEQSHFERAAKYYFIFIKFDILWSLNYFALIVLNFFEKPMWCARYSDGACNERDYFYLGQLPYLTGAESLVYEGFTLIILAMHVFFPIAYEGHSIYWGKPLNRLKVICLLILVADLLVYSLFLSPVAFDSLPFRLAPYVRVVFFILSIRELRNSIVILTGMLGTYFNIMALLLLFLLFSSWVAYVMFEDTKQGKSVFTSYGATLYQMFVLYTTSNNPDVWVAAYKAIHILLSKLKTRELRKSRSSLGSIMSIVCPDAPGKGAWPELVGTDGEAAVATIKCENPRVNAFTIKEGTPVTKDLRCDRVRVWVNECGKVTQTPLLG